MKAILLAIAHSIASSNVQTNVEVLRIKEKIYQERASIVETEIKKRGVLGSLYDINKNLSKLNNELSQIETQLAQSKKKIEAQSALIARLEKTREIERVQLADRLRALYKMGFQGYAQMLLSSHSSHELDRNVKFLKIITEKDAKLLKGYKEGILRTAAEQIKLRSQVKTYAVLQKALEVNHKKIADEQANQVALLRQIEKDKQTHVEALKEWREAAAQLEEKLRAIERSSALSEVSKLAFFEKQGHYRPPVMRRISQRYGISVNTKFDTKIFHKGLFFAARTGDEVSSISDGKVVYSGWVNGFGQTIIIDHGDHYYSLYAHNSQLLKKQGDSVTQGELISRSGDTGSLRGPGLYFEIRHFSESLDPLPWLDIKTVAKM